MQTGEFIVPFDKAYEFGDVEYSHGGGTVHGTFFGVVVRNDQMLRIAGGSKFYFTDIFADPLDIDVEVGGIPYAISGDWTASFSAEVFADRQISEYRE